MMTSSFFYTGTFLTVNIRRALVVSVSKLNFELVAVDGASEQGLADEHTERGEHGGLQGGHGAQGR